MTSDACSNTSPSSASAAAGHGAAALAIVSNALTPYRAALQLRVAREIPEVMLWSIFTHQESNAAWAFEPPAEIRAVLFGEGEKSSLQANPSRALHEWSKGGRIIRWLVEHRVKAVLLEGYNDFGRLRILRWCGRNGVPVLLWGDSNIRGDRRRGIWGWVKRIVLSRILRRCSAALACGIGGREYFAKYGMSHERIFNYPVEPDYQQIEHVPDSAIAGARARFGLEPTRRRMVFSGRLTAVKRPELLIEAFAMIATARPQWDLVMMGDGALRRQLEERLPPLLRRRVVWTGFIGEQETVNAVYRSCDVLVIPSDYEPWALVVNEAAAAGLAIVASDVVGAAAELVRDGVNGYCFPAGHLEALADRLLRTTNAGAIDGLKRGSAAVLAEWRRRGDPIAGLRQALEAVGGLPTCDQ